MTDSIALPPLLVAQAAATSANAALATFVVYTLAVFFIAWLSNRLLQSKSFMSEYFLGSRSLGVWAFALTFAATSSSGGSFTGFPSLIYTHGWVLALWIASYMVVPVCTMGLLGKRINQVARKTGAITVPDVLRDRFESVHFELLAMLLIVFFMTVNLVAQFKAGSLILQTLLADIDLFHSAAGALAASGLVGDGGLLSGVKPDYLLCLFLFALAVIFYTAYGGFHAVVWTDVMQGIVMVAGVLIMLPLAVSQVGGLAASTAELAKMTPPLLGAGEVVLKEAAENDLSVPSGTWFALPGDGDGQERLVRTGSLVTIPAGETSAHGTAVPLLEMSAPTENERRRIEDEMLAQIRSLPLGLSVNVHNMKPYKHGAGRQGVYVTGPGPDKGNGLGFLPLSLAISFFFMWAISGAGQPSNMVRLMAFRNVKTLRRAIFTVSIYYTAIYFPLVIIFCCARVLLPGMELESDRIMPSMAVHLTSAAGWPWLAGLLVAAPFAAIMSTVDSFLLMISSALVRDVYQRNINPAVTEKSIKRLTYVITVVVGLSAMLIAINPPEYLQTIIIYTGSGLAAAFLMPVALALYWPRMNAAGAIAGMLGGFAAHLFLYLGGLIRSIQENAPFRPLRPLDFDPIIVGLLASLVVTIIATLLTSPPPEKLVRRYFYRQS